MFKQAKQSDAYKKARKSIDKSMDKLKNPLKIFRKKAGVWGY